MAVQEGGPKANAVEGRGRCVLPGGSVDEDG